MGKIILCKRLLCTGTVVTHSALPLDLVISDVVGDVCSEVEMMDNESSVDDSVVSVADELTSKVIRMPLRMTRNFSSHGLHLHNPLHAFIFGIKTKPHCLPMINSSLRPFRSFRSSQGLPPKLPSHRPCFRFGVLWSGPGCTATLKCICHCGAFSVFACWTSREKIS